LPKDEVKEVLGRSPDFSDTALMRPVLDLVRSQSTIAKTHLPSSLIKSGPTSLARNPQSLQRRQFIPNLNHGIVQKKGLIY
jgi:hypothetical protein